MGHQLINKWLYMDYTYIIKLNKQGWGRWGRTLGHPIPVAQVNCKFLTHTRAVL